MPTPTISSRDSGSPTPHRQLHCSAAERGSSSRRSRSMPCRASRRDPQPAWILAQHTGPRDERQRADVPGESDQSHSERSAPAADRLELGLRTNLGQRARATSGIIRPIASTPSTGGSASASSASSRTTCSSRCPTWARSGRNLPMLEQLNYVPQHFRTAEPAS